MNRRIGDHIVLVCFGLLLRCRWSRDMSVNGGSGGHIVLHFSSCCVDMPDLELCLLNRGMSVQIVLVCFGLAV